MQRVWFEEQRGGSVAWSGVGKGESGKGRDERCGQEPDIQDFVAWVKEFGLFP